MIRFYSSYHKMTKEKRMGLNVLPKSRIIKTGSTKLNKIEPNNECKSLVVYGSNLCSNIGFRLTPIVLNTLYLTPFMFNVLIGNLLGDANIRIPGKKGNPQIQFNQGFIHLEYILHLFHILSPIVTHLPSLVQRRDLTFYLMLYIRCLASLFPLYHLFIIDGVKRIPCNIAQFLTPVSLAFSAMDDGSRTVFILILIVIHIQSN